MLRNVIFDIGGVLADYTEERYFQQFGYDEDTCRKLANATMRSFWWQEYDRGLFSDEKIRSLFEEDAPDLTELIEKTLTKMPGLVTGKETALPWIRHIHALGRKTYYLSNFSKTALEGCGDALDFRNEMDGGILSFKEGVIKPNPEIYRLLLERYQLNPAESVFIDDTKKNLPMAEYFGIGTILYTGQEQAEKALDRMMEEK